MTGHTNDNDNNDDDDDDDEGVMFDNGTIKIKLRFLFFIIEFVSILNQSMNRLAFFTPILLLLPNNFEQASHGNMLLLKEEAE